MAKEYSKVKKAILKSYLTTRGLWRSLWLKKGEKYYGGRNKRDGVYLGDRTFYETFYITGLGYHYLDSHKVKYTYWELGMFKWEKRYATSYRRCRRFRQ